MFTGIIKESSGTKIAECNEIIMSNIIIHDEYESSSIASQVELKSFLVIAILITLDIPIYQLPNKLWATLSLTQ